MYHQLTNNQTKLWLLGGDTRREIAANIATHYHGERPVGVVAWRGQLIAWIGTRGEVKLLSPPFQRVHRNAVENSPAPQSCACAEYYDPEVGGPWKNRDLPNSHHPYCQFDKTSHTVFGAMMRKACQSGANALRPDEHLRERDRALGKAGEKSGARKGN